jgi:choline-sulfatase
VTGPRFASAGAALRADLRRGLVMAAGGFAVLAPIEYVATVWAYPGDLGLVTALRVAALVVTLCLLAWVVIGPVIALGIAAPRLWRLVGRGDARAGMGFAAWRPRPDGPRPGAAWAWALFLAGAAWLVVVQRLGVWAIAHFKEPQRTALLIAAGAAGAGALALVLALALRRLVALAADALYPILGPWSPFTSWRGVTAGTAAIVVGALVAIMVKVPSARPDLPWRPLLSAYAFGAGLVLGARRAARPRRPATERRRPALIAAAAALILIPWTLTSIGADVTTKYTVVTSSPVLDRLIAQVRRANDFDGDGFGSLLGENDCAPFDKAIHPGATDIPDDGIDQNCDGHDFSLRNLVAAPTGPHLPVPEAFQRPWNVLLITIDATRYDHTTFGGYKDGPKHRDTTPNLARLVARSTDFTFANAAAPGTMASVPAIISSKFFHNGLALDEHDIKPGMPPRLKPENTLLPEIMKRGGYTTGAILTHEYFMDWGMQQGVDDMDLSLAKDPDPFKVTSPQVTDHIIAWISRHAGQKWFLWAHYLDPHGRYVAHPDVVDYGSTEEDKYDSEIFFTDKYIGKLLAELPHLPGGDRTIIVITADHGDGFMEHGFINHGMALYFELLHVPLVFYVPDNPPRKIGGAVSGLDIVPTIAELCGIDVSDLHFEGKSLVPQIFYGKADPDRVVFSETNWPKPLRSATSASWKLIYDLDDNLYQLYDLKRDPHEKNNVVGRDKGPFEKMKALMDAFLSRVVFARDPEHSQVAMRIADVLLGSRPTPAHLAHGVTFDDGRIELVGWDLEKPGPKQPGDHVHVHAYFAVKGTPTGAFRLQAQAWPISGPFDPAAKQPPTIARSKLRVTLEGLFPSDHWRKGDFIKEKFGLILPKTWHGDQVALGVWMAKTHGGRLLPAGGPTPQNDPSLSVLGTVPFAGLPPIPAPQPPAPQPPAPPTLGPALRPTPAPPRLVPHPSGARPAPLAPQGGSGRRAP